MKNAYIIAAIVIAVLVIGYFVVTKKPKKDNSVLELEGSTVPEELQKMIDAFDEGERTKFGTNTWVKQDGIWILEA